MSKNIEQNITKESILYNNILLLSRNKFFYSKINLSDTFQNRIYLIFIHISFIMIRSKLINRDKEYKIFYQKKRLLDAFSTLRSKEKKPVQRQRYNIE